MKIISKSLEDTEKIVRELVEKEFVRNEVNALVIGLYGDLGSGKTAFHASGGEMFRSERNRHQPDFCH